MYIFKKLPLKNFTQKKMIAQRKVQIKSKFVCHSSWNVSIVPQLVNLSIYSHFC